MIDLEEFVKLDALNKVLVTNSPHYRDNINLLSVILDFEMVGDE
jgi:hypothetical protein